MKCKKDDDLVHDHQPAIGGRNLLHLVAPDQQKDADGHKNLGMPIGRVEGKFYFEWGVYRVNPDLRAS